MTYRDLTHLSELPFPTDHIAYLKRLKEDGFEPKVIYDIGSCVLNWTNAAKEVWPDATFVLFDAFSEAEFLYEGYQYHMSYRMKKRKWTFIRMSINLEEIRIIVKLDHLHQTIIFRRIILFVRGPLRWIR